MSVNQNVLAVGAVALGAWLFFSKRGKRLFRDLHGLGDSYDFPATNRFKIRLGECGCGRRRRRRHRR